MKEIAIADIKETSFEGPPRSSAGPPRSSAEVSQSISAAELFRGGLPEDLFRRGLPDDLFCGGHAEEVFCKTSTKEDLRKRFSGRPPRKTFSVEHCAYSVVKRALLKDLRGAPRSSFERALPQELFRRTSAAPPLRSAELRGAPR
eukprot:gene15323-biopygen1111